MGKQVKSGPLPRCQITGIRNSPNVILQMNMILPFGLAIQVVKLLHPEDAKAADEMPDNKGPDDCAPPIGVDPVL